MRRARAEAVSLSGEASLSGGGEGYLVSSWKKKTEKNYLSQPLEILISKEKYSN